MFSPYLMTSLLLLCFLPPTIRSHSDGDLYTELLSLRCNSSYGSIELSEELLGRIMSVYPRRSFFFAVFFYTKQFGKDVRIQQRLFPLITHFNSVAYSFDQHGREKRLCYFQGLEFADYNTNMFFFYMEWEKSAAAFSQFGVNAVPQIRIVSPNLDDLRNSVNFEQGNRNSLAKSLSAMMESKIRVPYDPDCKFYSRSSRMKFYAVCILLAIIRIVYGEIEMPATLPFAFTWSVWILLGPMTPPEGPFGMISPRQSGILIFLWLLPPRFLFVDKIEAVAFMYGAIGLTVVIVTPDLLRLKDKFIRKICVVITLLLSFRAVLIVFHLNNGNILEHSYETDI